MLSTSSANKFVLMSKVNIVTKNYKSVFSQAMDYRAQTADLQTHTFSLLGLETMHRQGKINPFSYSPKLKGVSYFSEPGMLSP